MLPTPRGPSRKIPLFNQSIFKPFCLVLSDIHKTAQRSLLNITRDVRGLLLGQRTAHQWTCFNVMPGEGSLVELPPMDVLGQDSLREKPP